MRYELMLMSLAERLSLQTLLLLAKNAGQAGSANRYSGNKLGGLLILELSVWLNAYKKIKPLIIILTYITLVH